MAPPLQKSLLKWYDLNGRHGLPWNQTKDPYLIWLSEVILQQTQVAQGLPYYDRFVERFPDVYSLSIASIDEVLKLWEGLGYYSRARNLHKGAQYIVQDCGGIFPETRKDLLKIPGVGPYTSAAIASFAYDLPHSVVDGNVIRIISRVHGMTASVQEAETLQEINDHVDNLIKGAPPASFNRAMMDLGATVCKSKNPRCEKCPWQDECVSLREGLQEVIPFKHKKVTKQKRTIRFLIDVDENGVLISGKRTEKDIWQGLYSLPEIQKAEGKKLAELDHKLTHRDLKLHFYTHRQREALKEPIIEALNTYAYPVAIRKGLESIL